MKRKLPALSIVAPNGMRIAQGIKTLEVRSWKPEHLPLKDLVIVENKNYLTEAEAEESGVAVAMVDIDSIHPWREDEIELAAASYWEEGYWAWVIHNVRPLDPSVPVMARRKIYFIEMDHA